MLPPSSDELIRQTLQLRARKTTTQLLELVEIRNLATARTAVGERATVRPAVMAHRLLHLPINISHRYDSFLVGHIRMGQSPSNGN